MELFVFYIQVNKDHVFSMVKNETIDHSAFVKGLLGYFSECEFSGEEGAFYSKFKFRSGLMTILEIMWGEEAYRNITKELRKTEEFNRFVGHIITDLNYCMDEGFQKVPRYKELQASKATLNEEQLQEYSTTKRIIKFSFSMGKDTLKILRMLTEMTPMTFDTDDWRKKFAQVINYYAQKLSTKNFKTYKIDNAKKLGLHPLQMISDLVNIYINISEYDSICKEICADDRSYSDDLLIDLGKTASKHNLITQEKLSQMENLINKLIEMQNTKEEMNKLMEDLPDEFVCQLTYEMMKDPVMLPNSRSIVDRKSIKQHIMLNGNTDPFSRQPLKLEEVIELPDLKAKIAQWYNTKIQQFNLPKKQKIQIKTGTEIDDDDKVFQQIGAEEETKENAGFFGRFNE
jgi:ubiquitin conjugation factor E4 B